MQHELTSYLYRNLSCICFFTAARMFIFKSAFYTILKSGRAPTACGRMPGLLKLFSETVCVYLFFVCMYA